MIGTADFYITEPWYIHEKMRYIILGGYGAMGKLIVKDLFGTTGKDDEIIVAGRDINEAKRLAKQYKAKRVKAAYADAGSISSLTKAIDRAGIVIHAVHHEFNINVMKACLKTSSHYLDLGGLYHYTKKQLKLHKEFKKKGLTAVIGIGAAPGITNVLAKHAAKGLDKVDSIDIRLGSKDFSTYKQESPLSNTYSVQTLLEEFSWKPAVFLDGKAEFTEPMSGRERYRFPSPVGIQKPQYTIHSEIATLPYTLKAENVTFKIAFDDDFFNKIKTLRDLGLTSNDSVLGNGIKNIDATTEILKRLPKALPKTIRGYEIIRVIVQGRKDNNGTEITVDAHVKTENEPTDKDTGVPPSIAAKMIADRKITKRGVFPPEEIIPIEEFIGELGKRNIYIRKYQKNKQR